jgi:hypothetical protein
VRMGFIAELGNLNNSVFFTSLGHEIEIDSDDRFRDGDVNDRTVR